MTPDFLHLFCAAFISGNLSFFTPAAETIVNVLDFKKDVGLWHGILTVGAPRPAAVETVSEPRSWERRGVGATRARSPSRRRFRAVL